MQKYEVKGRFKFIHFLTILIVSAFTFYGGYSLGAASEITDGTTTGRFRVVNRGLNSSDLDFRLFWEVWDTISANHLNQPVDQKALFYGAIEGMVAAVGDPYSNFFDPDLARQFNQDLEGSFYGIGAEIGLRDGIITIVSPLSESPAEKAGLLPGDKIIAVDGNSTEGWSVNEAVSKIRGELGKVVELSVFREGDQQPRAIRITRAEIVIESVVVDKLDNGIVKIEIRQFNEDTTRLFNQAIQSALQEDIKGLVIDLRNNPGGLLNQAINVADFWINDKVVTIERTRIGDIPLKSNPGAILADIKTVVLVNGGSASASEILSGALQDYKLARVIGEQTFGKGSVQEYRGFGDGSAVKITTAKWLTPNGRSIDEVGIEPDEVIELTIENLNAGQDPQLDAALNYLKNR
jgi:carboxyl-terminal processing protease